MQFMKRAWLWLVLVALLAGVARFAMLGHGVMRADELNRYLEGRSPMTLVEYWRTWAPANQIPVQNVLSMGVARLFPEVNEFSLRVPGAVMGVLTVLMLAGWIGSRWGVAIGLFSGIWLALNPFHLHESRESYYYGLLMFTSTIFSLYTLELIVRVRDKRQGVGWRSFAAWTLAAYMLCMSHMSAWIYVVVWSAALLFYSIRSLPRDQWKRIGAGLTVCGVVLLVLMRRWISDAIGEVRKVAADTGYGYIGDRFSTVAPRVIPMFLASIGWLGWGLFLLTLVAAVYLWTQRRKTPKDVRYGILSWLTGVSVLAVYLYVGGVGGGVAKETFFSVFWPVLLPWSAITLWKAVSQLMLHLHSRATPNAVFYAGAAALFAVLLYPAWMLVSLDGKPTPYRQIAQTLDRVLPGGSMVVVDRWFEPWVEMSIYPPTNVFVTFTIPDEPLQSFLAGQWRTVTRQAIETGRIDAYLRVVRNHEHEIGAWGWLDTFFARHVEIRNEKALWLRKYGYSVMSGLHDPNTNRVVTELFYNTQEDWIALARKQGQAGLVRFGVGWGHAKPWRMEQPWLDLLARDPALRMMPQEVFQRRAGEMLQLLWLQSGAFQERGRGFDRLTDLNTLSQSEGQLYFENGRWQDYRLATRDSVFWVVNLAESERDLVLEVEAVAEGNAVDVKAGPEAVSFPPGLMVRRSIPLHLSPGSHSVPFAVEPQQVLLVQNVRLVAAP